METENTWDGVERRQGDRRKVNKWVRRALILWIILFSALVIYAIRNNRTNTNESSELVRENAARIAEIRTSKATVAALQRTNCGLLKFLLTARKARWDAYKHDGGEDDLQAVQGYEKLAEPFLTDQASTGNCPIPKRIIIPSRPLISRGG